MKRIRLYVFSLAVVSLFMAHVVELRAVLDEDCNYDLSKCKTIVPVEDATASDSSPSSEIRRKRNFLSNEFSSRMIGNKIAAPILDAIYEEDEESPWLDVPFGDLFTMFIQMGGKAIEGDKHLGFAKPSPTKSPTEALPAEEDIVYDDIDTEDAGSENIGVNKPSKGNIGKRPGPDSSNIDAKEEEEDEIMDIPTKQSSQGSRKTTEEGQSYYNREPKIRPTNRRAPLYTELEDSNDDYHNQYSNPYSDFSRGPPQHRRGRRPVYGAAHDAELYNPYQQPHVEPIHWNNSPAYGYDYAPYNPYNHGPHRFNDDRFPGNNGIHGTYGYPSNHEMPRYTPHQSQERFHVDPRFSDY